MNDPVMAKANFPTAPDYCYRAKVVKVVDGDTIDVDLDVGFNTTIRKRLRLYGVNTWETRGSEREKGLKAKTYVENMLLHMKHAIWVETFMDAEGKYGRVLALVWCVDVGEFPGYKCLNTELLRLGHGREYMKTKGELPA